RVEAARHLAEVGQGSHLREGRQVRRWRQGRGQPRDEHLAPELDAEGGVLVLRARGIEIGQREDGAAEAAEADGVSVPALLGRLVEPLELGGTRGGGVWHGE